MKDEVFINEILQKGAEAKIKAQKEFSNLTTEQLNWKAAPQSWSIGQCLSHLIISDAAYFPELKKISEGNFKMSFWEKHSPFSKKFGQLLKGQLQEKVKRKMTAPKKIRPTIDNVSLEIIESYDKHLDAFLRYISNCKNVDIDKTKITSPVAGLVTYSVRDAFQFLLQHEHRHINQAIFVKQNENFPIK